MRKINSLAPLCSFCGCVRSAGYSKVSQEKLPTCKRCAKANSLFIKPFSEKDLKQFQEGEDLQQLERLGMEPDLDYQEFHRLQSQEDGQ